jgi:hypothetical protein
MNMNNENNEWGWRTGDMGPLVPCWRGADASIFSKGNLASYIKFLEGRIGLDQIAS